MALLIAGILISLAASCAPPPSPGEGFAIVLAETGEVILSDEHIAAYVWDRHHIVLTQEGTERWESLVALDRSHDPPLRMMGGLTGKVFIVQVNKVEMYRGHFWSMVSSLMRSGVLLFDTLGLAGGDLRLEFVRLDEKPPEDPRLQPAIAAHFRKHDKLR